MGRDHLSRELLSLIFFGCASNPKSSLGRVWVRMKFSAAGPAGATLFLGLAALISSQGGEELDLELDMGTCVMDPVVGEDAAFCRGGLEVIYPELGDVGCLYIPRCNNYRERISKEWNEPSVRFPQAHPKKKYVLMMVDPDAYSRADPKFRYWRHWLVTEIQGSDLQAGKPKGHVLAKYYPPGPPRRSGYHRYQFLVYEQPAHETILLSSNKSAFRGAWHTEKFVERFRLGSPAAATQFLTENYRD
uniref:Phosphatidylethanolamine binding protein 4 n=1 Tax=Ornithorhynchus anatinus TaxID=9258 RepID=K7ECQ6_ORNAN